MIPVQILEGIFPRNLITKSIVSFCASLDAIAFQIFGWLMQAVFDIANLQIISEEMYTEFAQRVYVILGIFMLFKVTISLLSYLVSPDRINDKERGMGKMVTRTVLVLIMLVGLPSLFNLLDRAQPILLEALPRIIIGKNMSVSGDGSFSNDLGDQASSIADSISWSVFQISLGEDSVGLLEGEQINTVWGASKVLADPASSDASEFKYLYYPVIGLVIALIMSFLLLGFCIDIAIRAFKLVILRMIAPIPIISYIDPKSSKDGAFNSWLKSLTSTWLDLFLRLGVLYLVLYLISEVVLGLFSGKVTFGWGAGLGFPRGIIVGIAMIIGLLFFARQAPKFITDALGIKNSKGMGIGLGGMMAAGGALIGGGGVVGAMKATGDYMNEAADAAATGKAAGPAFGKGKDIAAQLRTGDKNAKGGLTNRFAQYATDNAANKQAKNLGLGADDIKNLKTNMIQEQTKLTEAQNAWQAYQTRVQSGQEEYNAAVAQQLQQAVVVASNRSRDAEKNYSEAKAARETFIRKSGATDTYRARPTHLAKLNTAGGARNFEKGITNQAEFDAKMAANMQKAPQSYDPSYVPDGFHRTSSSTGPSARSSNTTRANYTVGDDPNERGD